MKLVAVVGIAVCLSAGLAHGQFKSQLEAESKVSNGFMQQSAPSFLFGWFNPEKFHMQHSLSFSYMTFGGQGMSLGTYTNSMMYEFADNLNAQADISLSYSPYNSLSTFGKNDLSSIYLSRAQVNYKPWENVNVQLQYRALPYGFYSPYSSSYYHPWYTEGGF